MTTVKVLAQSNPSATTLTDAYTVPAATTATVSSITVCNQAASATTFRVSVAVAGAANATKQYLYYDVSLDAYDTFVATIGITLGAADVIRVYSGNASTSFNIFGVQTT